MGQIMAALYTPNDNLEHALVSVAGSGGFLQVKDVAFSPERQGFLNGTLTTKEGQPPLAGVYSPVDNNPYLFYVSVIPETNSLMLFYSSSSVQNVPITDHPFLPTDEPLYISNIDAYFSPEDNLVHVILLVRNYRENTNGLLWHAFGAPWSNDPWTIIPFLLVRIPYPDHTMCAYYSPQDQHGHAIVTTPRCCHQERLTQLTA